jgi:major membrane immunogen (membrane-anchored lipoprotein)
MARALSLTLLAIIIALAGCQERTNVLVDGYYTAQVAGFGPDGWKEYLTVYVNDGTIATAEFNAFNASGLLRSWDQDYISDIYLKYGVNPNHFPRLYANTLVSVQDPSRIQAVTGGRNTHAILVALAVEVINSSRTGNTAVIEINRPEVIYPDDI